MPTRCHQRKTDRKWGEMWTELRDWVKTRQEFSPDDYKGRFTRKQVQCALSAMARFGELRVVKPRTRGRNAKAQTYARNQ